MCGLFGGLGKGVNPHIIRTLAILNESRGHEATGFFNSRGMSLKLNDKSTTALRGEPFTRFIDASCQHCWAICGHTRASTRGNNTVANAHPFKYGKDGQEIIGSHNGNLDAPHKYSVDSQYAMDLLSQNEPGDYKTALGEVAGWYVLTWWDARDKSIHLLNWQGQLSFCNLGTVIYYSSDPLHLQTAVGNNVVTKSTKSGDVWRFDGHKFKQGPHFKGKERWQQTHNHRTHGFQQNHQNYNRPEWPQSDAVNIHGFTGEIQKFDCGMWWGCTHKMAEDGKVFWVRLGNQAMFNRLYPDARIGQGKYPHVSNILSEEQVERMQKSNEERAKKGLIVIEGSKTPPLLAGVVQEAIDGEVLANVSQPGDAEVEALTKLVEEINEFKDRYGTDRALDARLGPDLKGDAELECFQERCLWELKKMNYSTEQAVAFLREQGVFRIGAEAVNA